MSNKGKLISLGAVFFFLALMFMPQASKAFTVFPTSAACTASGGVMGDLNHDTKINDLDVAVISHIFVGTEPYTPCGDFDSDGIIGPGEMSQLRTLSWDIDAGRVIAPTAELWTNSFYNPYRIPACQTVFGDVNGDLKADYQDVSIIQYMIVMKLPASLCGDSNSNGIISPVDYSVSQGISLGLSYAHLEKPIITLIGSNQITLQVGTVYTELGATANDTQDGDLTASILIDSSAVNTAVVGTYVVTYNVTDSNGNNAMERLRQVNVVDTTIPVITLLGVNPQAIARGRAYVELGATANDNYDGDITASILIDASAVNISVAGTYTVTYDVTDANGNPATQVTRTVNVISTGSGSGDVTPPTNLSLVINDDANISNNINVILTIGATDASQMVISNDSEFDVAQWEPFSTSKDWQLTEGSGRKVVYAKFRDSAGNVSATISDEITLVPEVVPVDETEGAIIEEGEVLGEKIVAAGTLIKRADISSVYFIGADDRRHAFPNEPTFFSYYSDFSEVLTVSAETLAAIPMGSNVTMNPGTWLVKIQSEPSVYAVEPSGVLRWISSEQIALNLYGSGWETKIVDIEPTFFVNYQIGSEIKIASYPTGQLISYQGSDKVYYVDQGQIRLVAANVFQNNNYQSKFVINNASTLMAYENGLDLPASGMEVVIALR